jgi:hypothetical protein
MGAGVNASQGDGNNGWICQTSGTTIAANATGFLYMNVDFQNLDSGSTGTYGIEVTSNADNNNRTAAIWIGKSGVYAEDPNGYGSSLLTPVVGEWYNVQLALNLTDNTYSGVITGRNSGSTTFANRSFVTENNINCIATLEGFGPAGVGVVAPGHDIDNWVLSDSALAPVPEPTTVALLATGAVALLAYAWRKRK